jgi:hypothetical protein
MFKLNERVRGQIFATVVGGILIGSILGSVTYIWGLHARMASIEAKENIRASGAAPETAKGPAGASSGKDEQLIPLIQQEQKLRVKESFGEFAGQCFTDDDLKRFIDSKTTESIKDSLRRSPQFLDVVSGIRQMEKGRRAALLLAADKPLHPTWGELGRISREGQTDAGQKAEKMVSSAIVRLVKELLELPNEQFLKLYEL